MVLDNPAPMALLMLDRAKLLFDELKKGSLVVKILFVDIVAEGSDPMWVIKLFLNTSLPPAF